MSKFRPATIFVSGTTRGLKSLRIAAAEMLRSTDYDVVVQEEFDCDYQRVKDMIRDKIAPCDAIVLLVGPAYGYEPADWPAGLPRHSYTQLEYEIGIELKKPVYRYLASAKYSFTRFDPEPIEQQQRQQAYIQRLKADEYVWYEFDSQQQLSDLLGKTRFHTLVKPNLPFDSIGTLFKGREEELRRVRQSLLTRPAHVTAVTSRQAIHGLGGVGKTRFAVEYGHRFASEYSARLYANADTPAALESNLAALCHVLDLPERHEKELPRQLEAVQRWLRMHAGWLLILDNVDTPEAQSAVRTALNHLTSGHVLITSRLTDWGVTVNAVELDTLSIPASTEFLLERTAGQAEAPTSPRRQVTNADPSAATELAADLGGLALALEQAGAYICANRITFDEYRVRLSDIERDVLKWFDADTMNYPKAVAVTWQASVNQLYADGRALLNLLAWLAPTPIPVNLIRSEPNTKPIVPISNRERALQDLSTYSLAKWNSEGSAVTVHRLVQDVTRLRLPAAIHMETVNDTLWMVDAFLEGNPQETMTWKNVYMPAEPHVANIARIGDGMGIEEPVDRLLAQIGAYYLSAANFVAAESACRRALTILERRHGADHPVVASILGNLAATLSQMGRCADAVPLARRAMAITKAAFGPTHLETAGQLNQLAEALRRTDNFPEAEQAYRDALSIYDASKIANDSVLATILSNLAGLLSHFGRPAEAEPLARRALAIDEALHGSLHLDVARDLNILCCTLTQLEKYKEAEAISERALSVAVESVGREHPIVAVVLNNQADILRRTNRSPDALPLCHRALDISEAAYGPVHPDVATVLTMLSAVLFQVGRASDAAVEMQRALSIDEQVSGKNHPDVAIRLFNLAELFMATDRLAEAVPYLKRALTIYLLFEAQTGHHHPQIDIAASEYGGLLEELGHTPKEIDRAFNEIVQDVRSRPQV